MRHKPIHLLVACFCVGFSISFGTKVAQAQAPSCTTPPDYKGPLNVLFNTPNVDCSSGYTNPDDLVVTCFPDADAFMQLKGDLEIKDLLTTETGSGRVTLTLDHINNIPLNPSVHTQEFSSVSPGITSLISYPKMLDENNYRATCVALGLNWLDCINHFGDTIEGNFNVFNTQTPNAVTKTKKQQYEYNLKRCNNLVASANGSATREMIEHVYYVDSDTSALEFCQQFKSKYPTWEEFKTAPPEDELKYSFQARNSQRTAYIVISVEKRNFFANFFFPGEPKTFVVEVPIDGLVAAYDSAMEMYQRHLTLKQQAAAASALEPNQPHNPNPNLINHPPELPRYQAIIDLIENVGLSCNKTTTTPIQFSGATTPAQTSGSIFISWLLNILNIDDALKNKLTLYKGWLIIPKEYIYLDRIFNNGDYSLYRHSTPLTEQTNIRQVDIPQPLTQDGGVDISATKQTTYQDVCPDGVGICTYTDTKEVTAEANTRADSFSWRGGGFIQRFLDDSLKLRQPTNHQFTSACYYSELGARLGDELGAYRDAAFEAGAAEFNQCPENSPYLPPSQDTACWSGDEGILNAGTNSSCSISFSGASQQVTPLMEKIFNYAGATYNVPPDLIAAIMFSEGGFEPRTAANACYGEYTDTMIKAASVCGGELPNCRLPGCNNDVGSGNSCDSVGPYQMLCTWEQQGVNRCNFYDSTMAMAEYLGNMRYGATTDQYKASGDGSTSCLGIPYNINGTVEGATCERSTWSCSDVITAIRWETGSCLDWHFQDVLSAYGACQ